MASIKGLFDSIGNLFDFSKPMDQRLIGSSNLDKKTFLSEASNVLEGAWSDYTGQTANQANIDYQKDYNEQVFKRADTQYQRTVADLRAAGLSSQLAAGAPSTVAGQSAAPQRTVGNESQAMERLVGMVNSLKQTNANINLTNAQADKAKAETAMVNKEIGTYGERFNLDMVLKRSEADYNLALTRLSQIEGQSKAEQIRAQIDKDVSSSKYNDQLRFLAQKQASLTDAQILGQYETNASIRQGVTKSKAEVSKINQEIKNLGIAYDKTRYEILESVARANNLDQSSKKIADEAVNIALSTEILRYNLMMSEGLGLRTTENVPSSMWSSMFVSGKTFEDILWGRRDSNIKRFEREVFNWNWKWTPLRWIIQKDFPFKFGK